MITFNENIDSALVDAEATRRKHENSFQWNRTEEIVQSLLELPLQVNHLHRCGYGEAIHDEVYFVVSCFPQTTLRRISTYVEFAQNVLG